VIAKGMARRDVVVTAGQTGCKAARTCSARPEFFSPIAATAGSWHEGEMSIRRRSQKRPIATSLLMAAILLIGIAAFPLLPVAATHKQISDPSRQRAAAWREVPEPMGIRGHAAARTGSSAESLAAADDLSSTRGNTRSGYNSICREHRCAAQDVQTAIHSERVSYPQIGRRNRPIEVNRGRNSHMLR